VLKTFPANRLIEILLFYFEKLTIDEKNWLICLFFNEITKSYYLTIKFMNNNHTIKLTKSPIDQVASDSKIKVVKTKALFCVLVLFGFLLCVQNVFAQSITSFTPASGAIGSLVTVTGTGLNSPTSLTIGGIPAIVVSNTDTSLVAMVMPEAATGAVIINTGSGNVTAIGNFTLIASQVPNSQQGSKLVGTGAVGEAGQGYSISISADGNTAIVGGFSDNGRAGAAWVYTRSGGTWSQQGNKLVGTGAVGSRAEQGYSVSISADGNTAIVGGCFDNRVGTNKDLGSVWVFTRSGGTWSQQGSKLVGTGAVGPAYQGTSVSISADGNTAIVGGLGDNNNAGAAWVYTRSVGIWSQQGSKLVGTGAVGNAEQGQSVSISADGNTAIVGGNRDNSDAGAAWVYTRSGGTWSQQGSKLVGSGALGDAEQGISVSISANGNTAMVGGRFDNGNEGAAWVYKRSGGTWSQQGSKLVGTGAVGNAEQGRSVSISADGNTAIVGGRGDNAGSGAAWVYTRSGGTWSQHGNKLVGTPDVNIDNRAQRGISISISADGNTAIVGAHRDNSGTGAAWVYNYVPSIISTTGTLSTFTSCAGTASAQQSFTVSGLGLLTNLLIIPPTGFEVSITASSGFGTSVSLTPLSGTVATTTIFIRLTNAASGTPSGNVACTSAVSATTQTVAVSGTVNALPTATLSAVSNVLTSATSFNLAYTATTISPNQYSITTGSPTAMPSFSSVSNASLLASPLSISIPASAANTYNFIATVKNSTTGCVSANNAFTLTVLKPVSINNRLNLNNSISIYPNPTNQNISIRIDAEVAEYQVKILNITGAEVLSTSMFKEAIINIANLAQGIYLIKVNNSNGQQGLIRFVKN